MASLKVIAWLAFGSAAICLVAAAANEAPALVVVGIFVAISGVLFIAASRVIELLTGIRDALAPKPADESGSIAGFAGSPRTIEAIEADLKRLIPASK